MGPSDLISHYGVRFQFNYHINSSISHSISELIEEHWGLSGDKAEQMFNRMINNFEHGKNNGK